MKWNQNMSMNRQWRNFMNPEDFGDVINIIKTGGGSDGNIGRSSSYGSWFYLHWYLGTSWQKWQSWILWQGWHCRIPPGESFRSTLNLCCDKLRLLSCADSSTAVGPTSGYISRQDGSTNSIINTSEYIQFQNKNYIVPNNWCSQNYIAKILLAVCY